MIRKMNPMVSKGNNKNIITIAVVVLLVLLVLVAIGVTLWFTLGNEENNNDKEKNKEKFGNNNVDYNSFQRSCCDVSMGKWGRTGELRATCTRSGEV